MSTLRKIAGRLVHFLFSLRPAVCGVLAIAAGVYAQNVLHPSALTKSVVWYGVAVVLIIVGWAGTFPAEPLAHDARAEIPDSPSRRCYRLGVALRIVLTVSAIGLNLFSVSILQAHRHNHPIAGWGWGASLILLVMAFSRLPLRARERPATDRQDN